MKKIKTILVLLFMGFSLIHCSSDGSDSEEKEFIDPSNSNALARALIITGDVTNGNPPPTSQNGNAPAATNNQTSATTTVDNTLYLPFNFATTGANNFYAGCYVQVVGANIYWDINLPSNNSSGQLIIPVGIPNNILEGNFTLAYCLYDSQGNISNVLQTYVTIAPPQTCPGFESGSDGLTIFTYDMGENSGNVIISYDTYSIVDRIDLFYAGQWIDGTGSPLGQNEFPPIMNCFDAVEDGYVGQSGYFEFQYNPSNGKELDIYVSGCIGGSTAWDIAVNCPE
ncbi:hypothetical protein [Psychroserpens ponticola]|uniref:Pesticidal crystal protein Cry22Aa Ig-like domain-containing protein n=1 Tax=Psychroserpens ponticola TaxID=2932268 RepID=A0ABY7RZY6_9FLAO|nr:hypothetical protein [Psychroserpens ponticola]WCO02694.1 hypothetical protein MUN68_004165 [Psychroserpens ponticola]